MATETNELTTWELNGERVIAPDDRDGQLTASEVLGGSRADADAASDTGVAPDTLTADQLDHLRRHGWCPTA